MRTHVVALTPEQVERYLETPYSVTIPTSDPAPTTDYSKRLKELGLGEKSARADDDGKFWQWYKVDGGIPWRVPCSNSMLRSTPHYAMALAKDQYVKYQRIEELISTIFSTLRFRILEHRFDKGREAIEAIRSALKFVLAGTIEKIAYVEGWGVKAIYRSSIDAPLLKELQEALPAGITVTHHNHYKEEFREEFKKLVAPDLPPTEVGRADFEKLLEGVHQISTHGFTKEERGKFVYDPSHPYTNLDDTEVVLAANGGKPCPTCGKVHPISVPKDPRTGKPATHMYGQVVEADFRIIDLESTLWLPLAGCPKESG